MPDFKKAGGTHLVGESRLSVVVSGLNDGSRNVANTAAAEGRNAAGDLGKFFIRQLIELFI